MIGLNVYVYQSVILLLLIICFVHQLRNMAFTRGQKLVKLAIKTCNEVDQKLLNLPSFETTKGLDSFEKNLIIQKKFELLGTDDVQLSPDEPYVDSGSEYLPPDEYSSSADSEYAFSCNNDLRTEDVNVCSKVTSEDKYALPSSKAVKRKDAIVIRNDIFEDECATSCSNDVEADDVIGLKGPRSEVNWSSTCSKYVRTDINSTISKVPCSTAIGTHTKNFFCIYCKKNVKRFARHLISNHKNELRVIDILRYPSKHKQRNYLISKIRNEGTFMYNTSKLYNKGDLIVTRRPNAAKKRNVKDYTPCPFCSAYFVANNLNRHIKNCSLNKEVSKSHGIKAQARSIQIEMELQHLKLHPQVSKLLAGLKNDDVSDTIKNDILLLRLASHLCIKYRTEKHLKHYTRQKLRQLARLLIVIKEDNPQILDLEDCLQPVNFPIVVAGVQKLAKLNEATGEFAIPSLASHLTIYLKECANTLYSMCILQQDDTKKKLVDDFKELMSIDFGASISRAARITLEKIKWNKPKLLPVTSDIQIFRDHLVKKADAAKHYLQTNEFSHTEWRILVEVTAALVLIFNRKRPGETERVLLSSYHQKQSIDENSEDYMTLSVLEKLLCKTFKRIEIRGKLGRRVPILLRDNHIDYIDTFLNFREKAGILKSNLYLFAIDHSNFLRLTDVLRRESLESGALKPELLRGTFLRKQVATTSQILDLNDNDMQMLADFMGHDIEIHKSHYRTPELTLQVARLSRLLIAVDEGDLKNYKDKTLKNIDVTKYLNVTKDTEVPAINECSPEDEEEELALKTDEQGVLNTQETNVQSTSNNQPQIAPNAVESKLLQEAEDMIDMDTLMKSDSNVQQMQPKTTESRKRQLYRSPNSTEPTCSKFVTPPKQKPKIKRKSWRTPEKKVVRKLFNKYFETRTLPTEKEASRLIKQEPILNHRTAVQLKAWICNQNKKCQQ